MLFFKTIINRIISKRNLFKVIVFFSVILLHDTKLTAQVPNYVPQNGLIAWYSFNGNANDLSGNNHHGTLHNVTSVSDQFGNSNSAYSFSGNQSSYIKVNHDSSLNFSSSDNYTISTWIKPEPNISNGPAGLLSKWNEVTLNPYPYTLRVEDLGNELSRINWANHTSNTTRKVFDTVYNNRYAHIVVKVENFRSYFYINGILKDSVSFQNANIQNSNDLYIGKRTSSTPRCFKGIIEDLGFWNRALSNCEIYNLYALKTVTDITMQPADQNCLTGDTAMFAIATMYPQNLSFQWQADTGNGFHNLTNTGQFTGIHNDTLYVSNIASANDGSRFRCIISAGICKDTSDFAVLIVTGSGFNTPYTKSHIKIYPNPVSDFIRIKSSQAKQLELEIIDSKGHIVQKKQIMNGSSVINIRELQSAMYFVRLYTDQAVFTHKIIVF